MSERRSATLEDCKGCDSEYFHSTRNGCWSFPRAVVVDKLRVVNGMPVDSGRIVQVPSCYHVSNAIHLTPVNGQCRSDWEGGAA